MECIVDLKALYALYNMQLNRIQIDEEQILKWHNKCHFAQHI